MDDSDPDMDTDSPAPTIDRVRNEIKIWENLSAERINVFKELSGLIDEFKLVYAMRTEVPLHYALFRQVRQAPCVYLPAVPCCQRCPNCCC